MKKTVITPEGTFEIELTNAEIAQKEKDAIQTEKDKVARITKEQEELTNKQSALTKLSALGLTEAEIKAIIG